MVAALVTVKVELIVAALDTANVDFKAEAPVTSKVELMVAALDTVNVEAKVDDLATYNWLFNEASPEILKIPFNEISSVTINV